jgi:hypothetical protein
MSKLQQVYGRIEREVVITVFVIEAVIRTFIKDVQYVYGWSRALSGV